MHGASGCRSNLSYGRYWEGRTQLQQLTSKLTDAVVMSLQFDRTSVPAVGATQEQIDAHDWFRDTFVHLISLMHAVALATLREDFDMENLVVRVLRMHGCRLAGEWAVPGVVCACCRAVVSRLAGAAGECRADTWCTALLVHWCVRQHTCRLL